MKFHLISGCTHQSVKVLPTILLNLPMVNLFFIKFLHSEVMYVCIQCVLMLRSFWQECCVGLVRLFHYQGNFVQEIVDTVRIVIIEVFWNIKLLD